eukprot:3240575-Amphidinium_carterae.1
MATVPGSFARREPVAALRRIHIPAIHFADKEEGLLMKAQCVEDTPHFGEASCTFHMLKIWEAGGGYGVGAVEAG